MTESAAAEEIREFRIEVPTTSFVTEIDGVDIRFIHARSEHEDALPMIVIHG